MNISFDFTWCKKWQAEFKIPKGYIVIKPMKKRNRRNYEFFNTI